MLTHARSSSHGQDSQPVPYEGAQAGMAADVITVMPLTVQQNVPNLSSAQTNPKTQVNPTLEQGDGRSPGWRWGWMRKNIPFNLAQQRHKQPHYSYYLRGERKRDSGHPPGTGPGQIPGLVRGSRPFASLAEPQTVYNTAAQTPLAPWLEPV